MPTPSFLNIIRSEHAAVAAMLRSLSLLVARGPQEPAHRFFESVRGMLFYIDEFPERRHHPTESTLLFPALLRVAPELRPVIEALEVDHVSGEVRVRRLQHLLAAWEFLGESRRSEFATALDEYIRFYLQHMQVEERQLLPVAFERLGRSEQAALDAAFEAARDPLAGGRREAAYDELFSRIVMHAPAPIGVGAD
ncbi:hemerythrin domain-containing protein [Ramlibacter tataouinensis]|uniref:hemerythrin domain-containing protein n=1 Tax=Ramlibacter tataouinensis TaxID=94132 RepID=UPI0022F3BE6B|nr:hemerythrin domain-containing protein [Ramlibacter tataouinensis]WBY03033.1 hemerythrin domain-containing protein [Ramlibacter tataouinensis]